MRAEFGVEASEVDKELAKITNAEHLRKEENPDQAI